VTKHSILDLAAVKEGGSIAESFRATVDVAQHAERWGFTRFWLAEHHNMPGIASAATAVLIGHVAGATATIRVGAGGVMLPNHAPLVIAEQFGTLETLYPGRIDLGLGRAPGTDSATVRALRRDPFSSGRDFPDDVRELLGWLGQPKAGQAVRAVPGAGTNVPVWLLGSSTFSAQLAAAMGLPFAFASHFAPQQLEEALHLYREQFKPSPYLERPYTMAGVPVIAADTDAAAQRLATSLVMRVLRLVRGEPFFIGPPEESLGMRPDERLMVESKLGELIAGGPDRVRSGIEAFIARTAVDEIMFTSEAYQHTDRLRSFEIVSGVMRGLETQSKLNPATVRDHVSEQRR
jgi:luciferase family oxidoreductase group 1